MRKNGFSLIELMISIAISMVALVAVSEVYVASRQTYKLQGMQAQLTEEGRFAMAMVQRIVSQAGFRQSPMMPMEIERISSAANEITVKFESDGANQVVCNGSVPAAGVAQTLTIKRVGAKLQCGLVDWVAPATVGTGNSSEVADFTVLLGVDTGPSTDKNFGCGDAAGVNKPRDCIADKYVGGLTGTETSAQIVALRVCLMLSSEASDSSVLRPAPVKNCGGTEIVGSQTNHKLYRTFRSTVLLNNR